MRMYLIRVPIVVLAVMVFITNVVYHHHEKAKLFQRSIKLVKFLS